MSKIYAIVGFGYYTFRPVERPNCFASSGSSAPSSSRTDEQDENVTKEINLLMQMGFWLCLFQALLLIPSITNPLFGTILCFLTIPELAFFIYMNVTFLDRSTRICRGEYISQEEKDAANAYLLQSEIQFLEILLVTQWLLIIVGIVVVFFHVSYTFAFRV